MHPDHSAGLTDPKTGRRLYPNAELVVHESEPRHWNDDTAMAKASERAKKLYFQCAREHGRHEAPCRNSATAWPQAQLPLAHSVGEC